MGEMFASGAKWIWLDRPQREKNSYACFRRTLELKDPPASAAIVRVTADSRYELWVNGTFVGHGPVRSWPTPWPVDEYDVRHLLVAGTNVIGLLVTHFGISTFQYLHDEPGTIAQVDVAGQTLVTDARWKATAHDGYLWPAPRITCQQGWEEQFDARVAPGLPQDWSSATFDEATWRAARVLRAAGEPPHETFEARGIPFLSLEASEPSSVRATDVVRPADYTFALNPRELINAADKSMNHILARMLLAAFVHSDGEQKIELHQPHTRPFLPWKLNGEPLKFDDKSQHHTDTGVAHATLKKGANLLMVRLPESEHHFWANLNVWTEHPVTFAASPDGAGGRTADGIPHAAWGASGPSVPAERLAPASPSHGWLALGPFAGEPKRHGFDEIVVRAERIEPVATADRFQQIWASGAISAQDLAEPFARPLRRDMVATRDVYATCVSDRPEPSVAARIEEASALLADNASWTTVHPAHDGAGVRLLLDFGRELVGFHEIELDAPAGAIMDVHNFEFIQRDGRFNLNESMNNSFRYVCREGPQRYKTFVRRGLRYSWVTFRNFSRPIRVRSVRVLNSTYPQAGHGAFECSDAKLTRIWQVGVHSVRCCSEDTYTDCPTYEQTLWVGDARNEALVDLVANGDGRLSARCLRLAGQSLARSKIVESQVPSGWQNLLPTWTFLWMRWAQEHFQLTGDRAFGREMLGYLDRNVDGMKRAINPDGLFAMFGWNLFDWAPMDTPADGIVTHVNCLASLGLRQCAQLARDLGDDARAGDWDAAARGLADAVNRHLWSEQKGAYLDCLRAGGAPSPIFSQQTQTAAYISGVATGERAQRCRRIVHDPPEGFVRAGSPFFMFFLLEALVQERRYDALVETIGDYWGKQVDAGATTFWEMYDDKGGQRRRLTRSHCHGWSAAPTFFLTQHVLGVQPAAPGYAKVRIAPNVGRLAWAQGRVPTPRGVVACHWQVRPGTNAAAGASPKANAEGGNSAAGAGVSAGDGAGGVPTAGAGNVAGDGGAGAGRTLEVSIDAPAGVPLEVELPLAGTVEVIEGKGDVRGTNVTSVGPRLKLIVRQT